MKCLIFLILPFIIISTYSTSLAQPRGLPVNHEPGKCYAKCLMPEGSLVWEEIVCNNQVTNSFILELQTALKNRNYYLGELDEQFSED